MIDLNKCISGLETKLAGAAAAKEETQRLNDEAIADLRRQLGEAKTEIAVVQKENSVLRGNLESKEIQSDKHDTEYKSWQQKKDEMQENITQLRSELAAVQRELDLTKQSKK